MSTLSDTKFAKYFSLYSNNQESEMDVARCFDMGIAAVMKSILIGEEIDVLEYSGSGHVSIAGADHSYYVKVRDSEAARARAILSEAGYAKYLIKTSS